MIDIEVLSGPELVATEAAALIAQEACLAIAERGRFVMAVSGGPVTWLMLRALSAEHLPWDRVHVVQVDERIAPLGNPDRYFAQMRDSLLDLAPLRSRQIHPMPVDNYDLQAAASRYVAALHRLAGSPPVLDLVQLGLGDDGHTASLVPGDPVLDIVDRDVALTGLYHGRRRMTLTYPLINRARLVVWLVTGPEKCAMLNRLQDGDLSIPAGLVHAAKALLLVDKAAAGQLISR